jgi:hypothetical protein
VLQAGDLPLMDFNVNDIELVGVMNTRQRLIEVTLCCPCPAIYCRWTAFFVARLHNYPLNPYVLSFCEAVGGVLASHSMQWFHSTSYHTQNPSKRAVNGQN